jgi:hypothetical protein
MLIFISVILGVFIHESTNHKCDHLLEGFGATRIPTIIPFLKHDAANPHESLLLPSLLEVSEH